MTFEVGDEGPFYEPGALRCDTPMNAEEKSKEKEKRKRRKPTMVNENDGEVEDGNEEMSPDAPYINQGFERRNKGIKQVHH
jgi:hypothetical protein